MFLVIWLGWVGFSYKNWLLLASDVEASVGVDVLVSGRGVFFRPWIVVWVKVHVLEDCLVIGGVVHVFFVLNDFAFYFHTGSMSRSLDVNRIK